MFQVPTSLAQAKGSHPLPGKPPAKLSQVLLVGLWYPRAVFTSMPSLWSSFLLKLARSKQGNLYRSIRSLWGHLVLQTFAMLGVNPHMALPRPRESSKCHRPKAFRTKSADKVSNFLPTVISRSLGRPRCSALILDSIPRNPGLTCGLASASTTPLCNPLIAPSTSQRQRRTD